MLAALDLCLPWLSVGTGRGWASPPILSRDVPAHLAGWLAGCQAVCLPLPACRPASGPAAAAAAASTPSPCWSLKRPLFLHPASSVCFASASLLPSRPPAHSRRGGAVAPFQPDQPDPATAAQV